MSSGDRTQYRVLVFCPFCKETEWLSIERRVWPGMAMDGYRGHCNVCGADGPFGVSPLAAADYWNERARK